MHNRFGEYVSCMYLSGEGSHWKKKGSWFLAISAFFLDSFSTSSIEPLSPPSEADSAEKPLFDQSNSNKKTFLATEDLYWIQPNE